MNMEKKLKFIPIRLGLESYNSKDEDDEEYGRVHGSIYNGDTIIGTSFIELNEEELEDVRKIIRISSKRKNKLINNL